LRGKRKSDIARPDPTRPETHDNPDKTKGIREKTRTGRLLGTNDFIERLEGQLNRLFKLGPKGRPKKKVDK